MRVLGCTACGRSAMSDRTIQVTETYADNYGEYVKEFTTMAGVYCSRRCVANHFVHLAAASPEGGETHG